MKFQIIGRNNKIERIFNTIAIVILAGSLAWCYVIRDRIAAAFANRGATPLPLPAWRSVEAGLDWSDGAWMNGIRIRPVPVGPDGAAAAIARAGERLSEEGWECLAVPENAVALLGDGAIQVFRRGGLVRVLQVLRQGAGGAEWAMDWEMDGNVMPADGIENFSLEKFMAANSRDLPGIPAPVDVRRFYSLVDGKGDGIVSYIVDIEQCQKVYNNYLMSMASNNWRAGGMGGQENPTVLMRGTETCLIGWNRSDWGNQAFITVVRHGN